MKEELRKKVDFAIKLLQGAEKMAAKVGQPVEIAYSGGKDSDVILELAKMSGINYRAIYKNTTIDPPGTIKHVREMGVEIMRPEKNFGQLIEERGLPTRIRRFCCSVLKVLMEFSVRVCIPISLKTSYVISDHTRVFFEAFNTFSSRLERAAHTT